MKNQTNLKLVPKNYNDFADEKVIPMKDLSNFKRYLRTNNMSDNTIKIYCASIKVYQEMFNNNITKTNLLRYKTWLIENYAPRSVNQKIQAMNKYLTYLNKKGLKLTCVRIQNKPFLENVITFEDYKYFIKMLKKDNNRLTYFLVRFIACTGARVSELVQFRVEHVRKGYMDLYGKGTKVRRIYIPKKLQKEALLWLEDEKIEYGPIFTYRDAPIKANSVGHRLKTAARKYPRIPIECVYPHSFRHMYAKTFLGKRYDLMLLADLLGHSSLEITRIYTRLTSSETIRIVDSIVDW